MHKAWLDPEDVETHVYFGPDSTPSAPMRLPLATSPAPRTDPLEIPSLVAMPIRRRRADKPLVTPVTLALAALCIAAGAGIGGLFGGIGSSVTPVAVAAVAPAVTAPPVITAPAVAAPPGPIIVPAQPAAATTDLRIESEPAGATVLFVADGSTTLVGTTPIDTTVDPARAYDVLVTLAGHVSRVAHVAAGSSRHVIVALAPAR